VLRAEELSRCGEELVFLQAPSRTHRKTNSGCSSRA
jgi:hypothetical protein